MGVLYRARAIYSYTQSGIVYEAKWLTLELAAIRQYILEESYWLQTGIGMVLYGRVSTILCK